MREILENSIDFSKLGGYTERRSETGMTKKAVISRETGDLTLELELNFVLPYEAVDKVRRALQGRLKDVNEINLSISYRDIIQTDEEAVGNYIGHMIGLVNGRYAHVTKTIYKDKWQLEEGCLTVYALGQMSVDVLNKEVSGRFEELLKRDLGIDATVRFENDTQEYKTIGREMEEKEKRVFEEQKERTASAEPSVTKEKRTEQSPNQYKGRRRKTYVPVKGNLIMGSNISGAAATPVGEVSSESGSVIIEGELSKGKQNHKGGQQAGQPLHNRQDHEHKCKMLCA